MSLCQIACWDFGFESRRGYGYFSLAIVACYQVQFSATGRSPVRRGPTDCGVPFTCSRKLKAVAPVK
jgi:hypothetical protein